MADWYVSSVTYAALSAWQATHAYVVGDLVKPTAPTTQTSMVYRCTTAGTSAGTEPTWSGALTNNQTRTDGTVTWTNVTGQSTYGWSAAAGTLYALIGNAGAGTNRVLAGDRCFLASDHSETISSGTPTYQTNNVTAAFGLCQFISVNRAGSVPPVAADVASGAAITNSANAVFILEAFCEAYWQGITFTQSAAQNFYFNNNSSSNKPHYLKNCAIVINNAGTSIRINTNNSTKVVLDNTTLQFGHANQSLACGTTSVLDLTWLNTPSALAGATFPTALFTVISAVYSCPAITLRGVDISALTGSLVTTQAGGFFRVLLDSCRIASGLTRLGTASAGHNGNDEVELVNCYDGTNVLNERYSQAGAVTTDRTTYLSGGAQDDVGNYSLKLVSSARADKHVLTLNAFWLDVGNTATGASKTATVEIISSGSLNNDDIQLFLEYMGTSGNPIASFGNSLASVLTSASALSSSAATWNSPPGTPQKQLLQVTFTPQRAGRVRGLVRLGKALTTLWLNPQITIS